MSVGDDFVGQTVRVQFRTTEALSERIRTAADECGMTMADWLREIVTLSVQAHEEREAAILAGVDFDHLDGPEVIEIDDDPEPDPEAAARYAQSVAEGAARIRAEEGPPPVPRVAQPAPQRPSPRDCIHHPTRRAGGRCLDCGTKIRAPMMSIGRSVPR